MWPNTSGNEIEMARIASSTWTENWSIRTRWGRKYLDMMFQLCPQCMSQVRFGTRPLNIQTNTTWVDSHECPSGLIIRTLPAATDNGPRIEFLSIPWFQFKNFLQPICMYSLCPFSSYWTDLRSQQFQAGRDPEKCTVGFLGWQLISSRISTTLCNFRG